MSDFLRPRAALFIATLLVLPALPGSAEDAKPAPSAPGVVVIEATERDVTPMFKYPGRAEAVETVDLRARVEGFLEQRNFREGGDVAKGDLLFLIEQEPYKIVVDQRNAELVAAQAAEKNADADYRRKLALVERKAVSQASVDESEAARASAHGDVLKAQAALRAAKLDLNYTEIRSPINGRIGRARYSIGNLVNESSDALATITGYNPIYVTINVSEEQLISARKRGINLENPEYAPSLLLSDGSSYGFEGKFDFLAAKVDEGTDTISVRAEFPNPSRVLLPGQFVSVVVRQKEHERALTVPQAAVQQDAKGYFILIVGSDNKVEMRRINVSRQVSGDWIVTDGLSVGEKIIVEGIQKAGAGSTVNPTLRSEPAKGS